MTEKIQTLHPDPNKNGVNIDKEKYRVLSESIIQTLQECGDLTFNQLMSDVNKKLAGNFEGSINWYFTTVKLDLEARGILERIPKSRPQIIRLTT